MEEKDKTIESPAVEKSKRDMFRERFSKRNPELNMDDEDAYYDAAGRMMDEYEGYESQANNMRSSIESSPAFSEMIMASREQENFDPVVWMVKSGYLDLDALRDDPEYSKKLAKARSEWLDKVSGSKKLQDEQKNNMPASIDAITTKAQEMGLDDKTTEETVGKIFELFDNLLRGNIPVDVFEMLAKGGKFDSAVADAHAEGKAEGLNTRVDDKLRKLSAPQVTGRQKPPVEKKPETNYNPFLAN